MAQPDNPNVVRHMLYNGYVTLDFNPKATKYRYAVTDHEMHLTNEPVRGVTSVLGDIINKKELMTFPLNRSNLAVFGAEFDAATKEYSHNWQNALIKPGVEYDDEELHEIMLEGSRQWTIRSDAGKDIGTIVHSAIELYLQGQFEGATPIEANEAINAILSDSSEDIEENELDEYEKNVTAAIKAFSAFVDWWESGEDKVVYKSEKVIYSRSMKYAGTFDLLVGIGDKVYILDIKTTNASKNAPMGIYPEMFLQLGGYSYAMREETGQEVDDVGVIRVGKDGRLFIATAKDIGIDTDTCERAFAFAVRLHDMMDKIKPFLADAHMTSHLNPPQSQVGSDGSN